MKKQCRALEQIEAGPKDDPNGNQFLTFTSCARWMNDVWGDHIPIAGTHYLYAAPGAGKSSLSISLAIDLGLQEKRTCFILTERSEEAFRNHFNQILLSIPASKRQRALDHVSFTDRVPSLTSLPDFLLGVLSRTSSNGHQPALVVIDSVNGDGVHPCSRAYDGLYAGFRIARSAQISFLALGHITKKGVNSGPQTIAHSVDTVSIMRVGWRRRYLQVIKNRFSPTPSEPTVLELDGNGSFRLSPHTRAMAATVHSLSGGPATQSEIQVSMTIPAIGKQPRIQCPGLPKGNIAQLLQSLERNPDLELPISYFNLDVQLFSESSFLRTMHFPVAVGCLASLSQIEVPSNAYFLGEMDLNQRLRALSAPIRNSIVDALHHQDFSPGTVLLCPAGDAQAFREVACEVQVLGFGSFLEFVDLIRNSKERFLVRAAA